ncbi:MAG: MoaD/ThiS family protein [Candidatus Methanoperedens sp.]|nr:MoaD/ThiS family protein [Candidatus Methanoperedens sp.]
MKIKVNYDFTQQELVGGTDVFEIANGSELGELLRIIDARIIEAGKKKGIDTAYKTTLADDRLNGCVVFINGSAPGNMLEQLLHDGDNIEFVYGFCGG